MNNPVDYWYKKYLQEKEKNEEMIKALQQKQEWSKEDEKMFNFCCEYLDDTQEDWLKSIKDRYTWKPSDEQITVLELACKYERVFTPKQIDILIGLKEQLKELKGE